MFAVQILDGQLTNELMTLYALTVSQLTQRLVLNVFVTEAAPGSLAAVYLDV